MCTGRAAAAQVRASVELLVEVPQRGSLRAVARGRRGPADRQGANGSEGVVLPARPDPHAAVARRLAVPGSSTPPATPTRARRRITLGASVGWADIYPPSYPEQWIDVTGLRGCFAYVHIADPENGDLRAQRGQQRGSGDRAAALSCTGAPKGLPRQRSRSLVRPRSVLVARCGSGAPRAFVCAARVAGCRGRASLRQQPGSGDLPVARPSLLSLRCSTTPVGQTNPAVALGTVLPPPSQGRSIQDSGAKPRFSSVTKPTTRPVHPWLLSLEDAGACHTAARAAVAR